MSKNTRPVVWITLVNWNGWRDTVECLASLEKLVTDDFDARVVVVDNGSTDDSVERMLEQYPSLELLRSGLDLGAAGGFNIAIRKAMEENVDYVWLLNNDAIATPMALAELVKAMGGRAAEEIIFGPDNVSNGASGDIKQATDITRRMVTEWGMSDTLGMVAYGDNGQDLFLGQSIQQHKSVSEATAQEIDAEVKRIIGHAYSEAKRILTERLDDLHALANGLLEYETLSGEEIRAVIRGEKLVRKVVDEPAPDQRRGSVPLSQKPDMPKSGGLGPLPAPG